MLKKSLLVALILVSMFAKAQENHLKFLVGTYTNACKSDGIYVYDFDLKTGNSSLYNHTEGIVNPSFLSLSSDSKIVYAVNESGSESTVSSFKYNNASGSLTAINKQAAEGKDPCQIIQVVQLVFLRN